MGSSRRSTATETSAGRRARTPGARHTQGLPGGSRPCRQLTILLSRVENLTHETKTFRQQVDFLIGSTARGRMARRALTTPAFLLERMRLYEAQAWLAF